MHMESKDNMRAGAPFASNRLLAVLAWVIALALLLGLGTRSALAAEEKEQAEQTPQAEQAPRITPAVEKKLHVSVRFASGGQTWAAVDNLVLAGGSSAWDATRNALTQTGLAYRTGAESTQDVIVALTNKEGTTLSADFTSGSGWHLYRNGKHCQGSSSTIKLKDGDAMEWRYEVGALKVMVAVVGPGGTGDSYWIPPTSVRVDVNATAWDASDEVFVTNGFEGANLISYTTGPNGEVWLDSLAALGENGITGESWQLFVNGELCSTDAAHKELRAGDSICWYYSGRGVNTLPAFVAQSGAAAQDPATMVRIDGLVLESWASPPMSDTGGYAAYNRVAGISVAGKDTVSALVWEGGGLMDPLAQTLANDRWCRSLSYVMAGKLSEGEGVRCAAGLDGRMYYLSDRDSLVSLEVR